MKIYLVGFMGSGKTTIGRELANRIEAPFFDLDELIESAEKMSIREIFAQRGEPARIKTRLPVVDGMRIDERAHGRQIGRVRVLGKFVREQAHRQGKGTDLPP